MDLEITLQVNGAAHPLVMDTRTTLLDALRERYSPSGWWIIHPPFLTA